MSFSTYKHGTYICLIFLLCQVLFIWKDVFSGWRDSLIQLWIIHDPLCGVIDRFRAKMKSICQTL